jgi:hypothetical protein
MESIWDEVIMCGGNKLSRVKAVSTDVFDVMRSQDEIVRFISWSCRSFGKR